jgi:hypothetical protein
MNQHRPQALTEADLLRLRNEGARLLPNAVARAAGLDVHALATGCSYIEHGGRCSIVRTDDARKLMARPQLAESDGASVIARLEAAEQRFEMLKAQACDERARAKQNRERAITRMQARLRSIDHAFAEDRAYAAQCIDSEAKHSAQTAAHQARQEAATQPAATPKPAPLKLVRPGYNALDLQDLVRNF